MNCVFCGESMDLLTAGFKACCSACGHYLHSCVQCGLFDRSSGRCRSLTTESVRDLEGMNYCEEYRVRKDTGGGQPAGETSDAADRFRNLFRNGDQQED